MTIYTDILLQLVEKNKYTKWYINIISNAQSRVLNTTSKTQQRKQARELLGGYNEGHHVLPRCLCDNQEQINDKNNIVYLTAREHYVVHWLLTKMFTDGTGRYKMMIAFTSLARVSWSNHRTITSTQYNITQRNISKAKSELLKGIVVSEETKRKRREHPNFLSSRATSLEKARKCRTPESRILSNEVKKQISDKLKNRKLPKHTLKKRRKTTSSLTYKNKSYKLWQIINVHTNEVFKMYINELRIWCEQNKLNFNSFYQYKNTEKLYRRTWSLSQCFDTSFT